MVALVVCGVHCVKRCLSPRVTRFAVFTLTLGGVGGVANESTSVSCNLLSDHVIDNYVSIELYCTNGNAVGIFPRHQGHRIVALALMRCSLYAPLLGCRRRTQHLHHNVFSTQWRLPYAQHRIRLFGVAH